MYYKIKLKKETITVTDINYIKTISNISKNLWILSYYNYLNANYDDYDV